MNEPRLVSYSRRAQIALVVVGVLYAWSAYDGYVSVRPWRDGSMFAHPPEGELGRLIALTYYAVVFTAAASVADLVLAAIARTRTTAAVYAAVSLFAAHTALQLYRTQGRYVSHWLPWVAALLLGIGVHAAYQANKLRRARGLASAHLVA